MTHTRQWFENWFDTPYYHILYKHRDHSEAEKFIDTLIHYLQPNKNSHFLDMACGNGRHAHFIAKKGFKVTGQDLSVKNIQKARQLKSENTDFFIHDMRNPFPHGNFDYILNLFTSFGYFDDLDTHLQVLKNVRNALQNEGLFLIDYFNAHKTIEELIPEEEKEIDGITFHIRKKFTDGKIIKEISFEDKGSAFHFVESVHTFDLQSFSSMLNKSSLEVLQTFGDYSLNRFDENHSPRLILLAKKVNHGVVD